MPSTYYANMSRWWCCWFIVLFSSGILAATHHIFGHLAPAKVRVLAYQPEVLAYSGDLSRGGQRPPALSVRNGVKRECWHDIYFTYSLLHRLSGYWKSAAATLCTHLAIAQHFIFARRWHAVIITPYSHFRDGI